jgi:hypothetical protein
MERVPPCTLRFFPSILLSERRKKNFRENIEKKKNCGGAGREGTRPENPWETGKSGPGRVTEL